MNSNSNHQPIDPIFSTTTSSIASQLESENVSSKDKPKKSGFSRCIKRMTRTFRTSKTKKKSANLDEQMSIPANSLEKQKPKCNDNVEERKVSFGKTDCESKDELKGTSDTLDKELKKKQTTEIIYNINSKETKEKITTTEHQDSPNLSYTKNRFHIICSHNDLHSFDLMQKNSARPVRYTGSIKYEGPRSLERILHEKQKANGRRGIIKNGSMKEIKFAKDESGLNFECSSFIDQSETQTR